MAKSSKALDPAAFAMAFDPEQVAPVYVAYGEERFLVNEVLRTVQAAALEGADPAVCLTEFDAKDLDVRLLLDELRTLPFLGPRRFVVLRDADPVLGDEKRRELLAKYIEKPSRTSCLFMTADSWDGRTKLARAAQKAGVVVHCRKLYRNRIAPWLTERARTRHGKALRGPAANALAESIGEDLGLLDQALEKVVAYVGDRPAIDAEDVAKVVVPDRTRSIFELCDAVSTNDVRTALAVVHRLLADRESPVGIVSRVAWQYERLWTGKVLLERGIRPQEVAGEIGVHPYFAQRFLSQAREATFEKLRQGFALLHRADLELKTSALNERILIESLMVRLCQA